MIRKVKRVMKMAAEPAKDMTGQAAAGQMIWPYKNTEDKGKQNRKTIQGMTRIGIE